ncbi:YjcZ family sporulation protein [Actinomycetes bacterium NPDC127524]|uniref:YjcZ family sporulation protein n=1 Tax=unclassified Bacillus (in: firmicutes) TaxID=185979 RepID=UPI0008EDD6F9|nr:MULTISPECIES: YjcZ family sporulation protein [unclassified Bacillus (in: firmicutes)]SFC03760.1 conserved hypothetical tiny transmembrane protein [Bacillus sp. OV322]
MYYGGYGSECCTPVPSYSYSPCYPAIPAGGCGFGKGFALIIVLFILLIIVGACLCN